MNMKTIEILRECIYKKEIHNNFKNNFKIKNKNNNLKLINNKNKIKYSNFYKIFEIISLYYYFSKILIINFLIIIFNNNFLINFNFFLIFCIHCQAHYLITFLNKIIIIIYTF